MTEGARERLEGEAIFFADRNTAFRSQDAAQQHATDLRELLARLSRYEAALRRIADPLAAMKKHAEEQGRKLDGHAAVTLARDPFYLQSIAAAALSDGETHERRTR